MALNRKECQMDQSRILIIAAVSEELALLTQALANPTNNNLTPFKIVEGYLGATPVVLCVSGVGKTNAAAATAVMLERYHPKLVINTGCAGAYLGNNLEIGDLVLASSETMGDEGVITPEGWQGFSFMGFPSVISSHKMYYNEIPVANNLSEKAMQLAYKYCKKLKYGRFVTVSTCSGTKQRGEELAKRFEAIAESMEGAAVAQLCLRYGISCVELRGISNYVTDRNMKEWNIALAVEQAQSFLIDCFTDGDAIVSLFEVA